MESEVPDIDILRQAGDWRWIKDGDITRAATLACGAALTDLRASANGTDMTILLADDALLHRLNLRFRGQDRATDILSFPAECHAGARRQLGDVALSEEAVLRGAAARCKGGREHLLHLVVHGVLHLCGHEHRLAREAREMEALETAILARISIADPYVTTDSAS